MEAGSELLLCSAATVLALRAARCERGANGLFWSLLAAASVLWLGGRLLSPLLGLAAYAAATAALLFGFRGASRVGLARRLVDLSAVAIALGGAGFVLAFAHAAPSVATAYGLDGTIVLVVGCGLLVARDGRIQISAALGGAATGALALAGVAWAYSGSQGFLTIGGLVGQAALAAAAATTFRRDGPDRRRVRRTSDRLALTTLLVTGCASVTALIALQEQLSVAAFAIGVYCSLSVGVRQALAGREKDAIARELEHALEAQHELAITDGLTGLHNRRFFEETLHLAGARSRRGSRLGLLVLDLDHFKDVNDKYGHQGGDAVLVEAAKRFRAIARPGDLVARYGGEEFVVMIPDARLDALGAIAERYRKAISERPFSIPGGTNVVRVLTSVGGACLPDHAATPGDLVRVADKALYEAKRLGRDQVCLGQTRDAPAVDDHVPPAVLDFLRSLADNVETHFSGDEHGALVASWAALVCDELGLSAVTRRRCVLAARLHDVGKIGVPVAILEKPGPLLAEEWRLVKRHPAIGARIVALAPGLEDVAAVIAAHHERPDGAGYPLGTQTSTIEARIVAVLDAWGAMTTDRPYRPGLPREQARAELVRGMGRQFDEDVVRAVLDLDQHGLLALAQDGYEEQEAA